MHIYRNVKLTFLSQGFYDNFLSIYKEMGMKWHGGYDFPCAYGEKLYYDVDIPGIVLNTEIDNKGGLGINIITENPEGIFKHRYWHLKDFNVKAGDKVYFGDLIGWADNTGYSTGSHLHRDMKEMVTDPITKALKIKNRDNGSFGTVPMEKYFINVWVLDQLANIRAQIPILIRMIEIIKIILQLQIEIKKRK